MQNTGTHVHGRERKFGCLGYVVLIVLLAFVLFSISNFLDSDYYWAKRLAATDPCEAAEKLSKDVRADWRGSTRSLSLLLDLKAPCVLRALVELMDLPDGTNIGRGWRETIHEGVKVCASSFPGPLPSYDPAAPLPFRVRQKAAWNKWIEATEAEKATS